MASYKVPQDVEADDKLLGPFTFRQFIYLIIAAMAIALAWGLAQIFVGLAVIPIPVILLFGVLALPLRKDQPMEIYLAAMVSFILKPKKRLWDPEGMEHTIEITAPKTEEKRRTKDLSENEAAERLSYLATLVDSQGWAIRGAGGQPLQNTSMNSDIFLEAQSAEDILDTNTSVANKFGQMMQESTDKLREDARQRMFAPAQEPEPTAPAAQPLQQAAPQYYQAQPQYQQDPVQYQQPTQQPAQQPIQQPAQTALNPATTNDLVAAGEQYYTPAEEINIDFQPVFNPYPTIQQSVMQPLSQEDRVAAEHIEPLQQKTEPAIQPTVAETLAYEPSLASVMQPTEPQPLATEAPIEPADEPLTTSETPPSADIIELANNTDLSVQTIARQASRLKKKNDDPDEVVISLR